jgi:hypothetical protein
MLIPRPPPRIRIKKQSFLVLLADIVVKILRDSKLAMQLLKRDTVVLKEEEAVVADGDLDLLDESVDNSRIFGVEQRKINGLERCKALGLLGDGRGLPFGDKGLAGEVGGGRAEGCCGGHCGIFLNKDEIAIAVV